MLSRFSQLDTLLLSHQDYWRIEPFQLSDLPELPWKDSNSQLTQWLSALSPEEITEYKSNTDTLLQVASSYLPFIHQLQKLIELPLEESPELHLPRGLDSGIPGRKLTQITSMGACSLHHHVGEEWLEWCSGVF